MMITKEQALDLDNFLNGFDKKDDCFTFSSENGAEMAQYTRLANTLENLGFIKIIIEQGDEITAIITQQGRDFVEYGGFKRKHEESTQKEEMEKIEFQKAKYALKAAKREPYLIAWSIISALIAIIISLIKCR